MGSNLRRARDPEDPQQYAAGTDQPDKKRENYDAAHRQASSRA